MLSDFESIRSAGEVRRKLNTKVVQVLLAAIVNGTFEQKQRAKLLIVKRGAHHGK